MDIKRKKDPKSKDQPIANHKEAGTKIKKKTRDAKKNK